MDKFNKYVEEIITPNLEEGKRPIFTKFLDNYREIDTENIEESYDIGWSHNENIVRITKTFETANFKNQLINFIDIISQHTFETTVKINLMYFGVAEKYRKCSGYNCNNCEGWDGWYGEGEDCREKYYVFKPFITFPDNNSTHYVPFNTVQDITNFKDNVLRKLEDCDMELTNAFIYLNIYNYDHIHNVTTSKL